MIFAGLSTDFNNDDLKRIFKEPNIEYWCLSL